MRETIAVIAGTPVDTQMGVDFLESKGIEAVGYQTAESPYEQNRLQLFSRDLLYDIVVDIVNKAKSLGINKIFVYCNSLSAAIDMDKVSKETGAFIVTPFTVYHDIAKDHSKLLIFAANALSCSKIETVVLGANKDMRMWSISSWPLVEQIENNMPKEEIYNGLNLGKILDWAESIDIDGIILGCTHFPYVSNLLIENTTIPIIDPAEKMFERLINH